MATSKTLTPTNVTIQIPDMTDAPDQAVNSNCIDKLGDAVNTLNSNIATKATDETAGGAYSDLNSLRTTGFYQYAGSSTGAPTTNGGSLICCFGSGGTQGMQIAHPNNQTFLSIRAYNNGTWTNWSNLTIS